MIGHPWRFESFGSYENAHMENWCDKLEVPPHFQSAHCLSDPKVKITEKNIEKSYYVYGETRCGKTHAVCALLKYRAMIQVSNRKYTPDSLFVSVPVMLEQLRQSYKDVILDFPHENEPTLFHKGKNLYHLVLDDLCADKISQWGCDVLFLLLDHRYNNNLHTVITCNLPMGKIANIVGRRVHSRIASMCHPVLANGRVVFK